jgi:hypothetical protein
MADSQFQLMRMMPMPTELRQGSSRDAPADKRHRRLFQKGKVVPVVTLTSSPYFVPSLGTQPLQGHSFQQTSLSLQKTRAEKEQLWSGSMSSSEFDQHVTWTHLRRKSSSLPSSVWHRSTEQVDMMLRSKKWVRAGAIAMRDFRYSRDYRSWRQAHGIPPATPIFRIHGPEHETSSVRHLLLSRGWTENRSASSRFFELKWSLSVREGDPRTLRPNEQFSNHVGRLSAALSTKAGLLRCLRMLEQNGVAVSDFAPRAFDLSSASELKRFLVDFEATAASAVLRMVLDGRSPVAHGTDDVIRSAIAVLSAVSVGRAVASEDSDRIVSCACFSDGQAAGSLAAPLPDSTAELARALLAKVSARLGSKQAHATESTRNISILRKRWDGSLSPAPNGWACRVAIWQFGRGQNFPLVALARISSLDTAVGLIGTGLGPVLFGVCR